MNLGGDGLRRDAWACLRAALDAVEPRALVARALSEAATPERPPHLVAIGKAAASMARGVVDALGGGPADPRGHGILLLPEALQEEAPGGFDVYGGGHPVPSEEGCRGARAIRDLASRLGDEDELLLLISGGGSALATLPPDGVPLEELQVATELLLRAGVGIGELNAVRKHLDQLKGGRLAVLAAPARVRALVLSDVVGNPFDVIASGPVSPDPTTFKDVDRLLEGRGLWEQLPPSVAGHLRAGLQGQREESPGADHACFRNVEVELIGHNGMAAEAALEEASRLGYGTLLLSTSLVGEAREAGAFLAAIAREIRASGRPASPPVCVVAAGETTVTVRGTGKGGRNQEVALGAASGLSGLPDVLLTAFGTDGIDGPTAAAGAFADGATLERARRAGLSARAALAENDAFHFFEALEDLVLTGPTGTNVMDLSLLLVR